jgi:alpha-tubulin suppressor-like RCC1 family protein
MTGLLEARMRNAELKKLFFGLAVLLATGAASANIPLSNVAQISAGANHACAVTNAGAVKCWGENGSGELGDGTTTTRDIAIQVSGLSGGAAAVSAGGAASGTEPVKSHTCALTTGGGVKCWGANNMGQLGDGTTTPRLTPVDVFGLTSGVAAIAAGGTHSCAVLTTGGVKCWGSNGSGELGDGTTTQRLTPVDVSGLSSGVAEISATLLHTCALTSAGAMLCWGANESGQLGDGTTTNRSAPVSVQSLTSDVASISTGRGNRDQATVNNGGGNSCAVTTSGSAKCWGANQTSQIGDGTQTTRLTPFDVSGLTSGVVTTTVGDVTDRFCTALQWYGSHSCALMSGGGVKCWGSNIHGQVTRTTVCDTARYTPVDVPGFTSGIIEISAGRGFTCGLTSGGGVQCWGRPQGNSFGVVMTTESGLTPQTITFGPAPTIAVGGTGTVSATGGGSGNPVVFTSLTPSVCSVSGSTVTGHTHDICTIAANQAGNASYDPAPQATQSFAIGGPASQTITFGPAPTIVVGGTGKVSATASSGLAVTFSSNTPSICSVSGNTVSGLAAGTCTIAANQDGNSLYAPAPQTTQNITITSSSSSVANLSVSQTQSVNPASVTKDVMYTMTVGNSGPSATGSVTLQDVLQPDAAFVWASGACSQASGTVTCNLGTLAMGASVVVKVVVRPTVAGTLTHTVTVSGSLAESDHTNNSASSTTTVNSNPTAIGVLRYRLYSDATKEHLFTTDQNEYNVLGANGWVQEGTAGSVLNNPGAFNGVTATPYYRLYNSSSTWHHWTSDANEYYTLIEFPGWNGEGVDGYILPTNTIGATQLYRLLYPFIAGLHHWTIDANEYNTLINSYGWIGEGGAGFVIQ